VIFGGDFARVACGLLQVIFCVVLEFIGPKDLRLSSFNHSSGVIF
jgi:hypothetical protein